MSIFSDFGFLMMGDGQRRMANAQQQQTAMLEAQITEQRRVYRLQLEIENPRLYAALIAQEQAEAKAKQAAQRRQARTQTLAAVFLIVAIMIFGIGVSHQPPQPLAAVPTVPWDSEVKPIPSATPQPQPVTVRRAQLVQPTPSIADLAETWAVNHPQPEVRRAQPHHNN